MNAHHPGEELLLDPTICDAHGFCADLLPELIELDEWGYPVFAGGGLRLPIPAAQLAEARKAVAACPVGALKLARLEAPAR